MKPDGKRFETIIETQLTSLYRAAYRLAGNPADAQDLVQDTCTAAIENPSGFADTEHPDRWLLRVLYNRFIDGSRRRKRSPVVPLNGVSAEPISHELGPEEIAELADRERAFDRAWLKLEKPQRALLSLRAEGYGLAEIENITGIGRGVLRARLHRARRSLARHLEERADPLPRQRRSQ
jgi:RNA polymerase sigma-70 factor (ECF subfamily)